MTPLVADDLHLYSSALTGGLHAAAGETSTLQLHLSAGWTTVICEETP